jgi:hypothetical protein
LDANFALLTTVTSAQEHLNLEETNASMNADLDTLPKEINVFLAMTLTALSATLKINAIHAKFHTYLILTTAALLIAETEPSKTLSTNNAFLAIKDAKFALEMDIAQNARKDYYLTVVYALQNAQMVTLLLKANVLLAKTRTVVNAEKTLTTAMNAMLLSPSIMLNAFLHALEVLTFQREDAENVILNARNAKTTKLASDANLNSTSTTENARLLALVEKFLLTENVSLALTRTARTA